MTYNKSFFGLLLAVLVLLPGCMHVPAHKKQSLQEMSDYSAYRGTENNVTMQAKLLSQEDKTTLFGDRRVSLYDNDVQVIQLSIYNISNVHYSFSPADIDLSMMSYRDIEKLMKTNSVKKLAQGATFGAAGAGAIGWGITGPMLCQSMAIAYVCLPLGAIAATASLVFLGKSIKSMIMNNRINKKLKEKLLHKKVIIKSGDHYEGLIFVKSANYNPQFNVTMHELHNKKNKIVFDVDVRKSE